MIAASIDLGTNSAKLLIGECTSGDPVPEILPLYEQSIQTRLGRGLYESGNLSRKSMDATIEVIQDFLDLCNKFSCSKVRIIATSAVREAKNGLEFAQLIHSKTNLNVEIISGAQEAELAYLGIIGQSNQKGQGIHQLLIDVGGGSTELVLGQSEKVLRFCSLAMGTVRCFEQFDVSDPPEPDELKESRNQIRNIIEASEVYKYYHSNSFPLVSVSTGGTAAAMVCLLKKSHHLNRETIDKTQLTPHDIQGIRQALWSVSLLERKKLPGIPKKKADILIMGVLIHEVLCELFKFEVCQASTKGLRYGVIKDWYMHKEL